MPPNPPCRLHHRRIGLLNTGMGEEERVGGGVGVLLFGMMMSWYAGMKVTCVCVRASKFHGAQLTLTWMR